MISKSLFVRQIRVLASVFFNESEDYMKVCFIMLVQMVICGHSVRVAYIGI